MNGASLRHGIGIAGTLVVMVVAACGGKVFVDVPGSGGGGGGSKGGLVADCQALCGTLGQCGTSGPTGGDPNCQTSCVQGASMIGDACKDEYIAYLDCLVDNLSGFMNCSPPPNICQAEINALGTCGGGQTGGGE